METDRGEVLQQMEFDNAVGSTDVKHIAIKKSYICVLVCMKVKCFLFVFLNMLINCFGNILVVLRMTFKTVVVMRRTFHIVVFLKRTFMRCWVVGGEVVCCRSCVWCLWHVHLLVAQY